MRLAARTDANHAAVVRALRQVGASVLDLSRVGQGCPDLLVGYQGKNFLVEVKATAKTKLTKDQVRFWVSWNGPFVERVNSQVDALRAIGAIGG